MELFNNRMRLRGHVPRSFYLTEIPEWPFLGGSWEKENKSDKTASILAVFASKKAIPASIRIDLERTTINKNRTRCPVFFNHSL
ncbi:hypothetical protein RFW18_13430 [Metabacillus idriensis]|uniref:hypothetical protein n=1 Tax=Metabacillus idriensis TaxID=324768 RepID=UPI002813F700|nr:hypothetical protein [Metabacillus idriensis]MDR0138751.1 hypothetical protein [Metabacillus idriensis]